MKDELDNLICDYDPMLQALTALFFPLLEIAIHDLKKNQLVKIYNNISRRNEGDSSPLKELKIKTEQFPDYFAPYYKKNWDGRELKCTSITIRDEKKSAIALICFNFDVSIANDVNQLLNRFLSKKEQTSNPIELFGTQCDKQLNDFVNEYLAKENLVLNYMNKKQKQELVHYLYHKGIFNFKNAASLISQLLKISRATVYNYIKSIGEK